MGSSDYFYTNVIENDRNMCFLRSIYEYSQRVKKQVYVIDRPLLRDADDYDNTNVLIYLESGKKIAFVNLADPGDKQEEFYSDVLDDVYSLSITYKYKDYLGRPREWKYMLDQSQWGDFKDNVEEWLDKININDSQQKRRQEALLSLFIGSINDVATIGVDEPDYLLDKIKHKIQLFDTQQTRFIYDDIEGKGKIVRIQGLSGTGKTELLLHKCKDAYMQAGEQKIGFTCYSKILADSIRKRLPGFFDFMKVDKQIDFEKLLCVNSWGNANDPLSGIYRYVCDCYDLAFYNYKQKGSFEIVCKEAKAEIERNGLNKEKYAFKYLFVDESQDFPQSFFDLCEAVTEKKVFVAGDVFQSIFDNKWDENIQPEFLLSKVYRTDPRTLMFAHALGMGLFEDKKLWWLQKEQWEQCGYKVEEQDGKYKLSREPLRRFEDVPDDYVSLRMSTVKSFGDKIEAEIKKLIEDNKTLQPHDIAIIFIDDAQYIYDEAIRIRNRIHKALGWTCNLAYESKRYVEGEVFISNRNNVKGLEFPFVFCITRNITSYPVYRNTLYTMLTRSFLRSYLLVSAQDQDYDKEKIIKGGKEIMNTRHMTIAIPTDQEQKAMRSWYDEAKVMKSLDEKISDCFVELGVTEANLQRMIRGSLSNLLSASTSPEAIKMLIQTMIENRR